MGLLLDALCGILGTLLFVVGVLVSGAAGFFGGLHLAPRTGICGAVLVLSASAGIVFALWHLLVLTPIVTAVEKRQQTFIYRPALTIGIIAAALIPLGLVGATVLLYIFGRGPR